MAKRSYRKQDTEEAGDIKLSPEVIRAMMNEGGMERMLADLTRLIDREGVQTDEELQALLERVMAPGGRLPSFKPETPLEKAQELVYKAWDTDDPRRRVRLARKALSISKDCADAYVILANDTADSPEEAVELYEEAVAAGERAMGPDAFSKYAGHFWGVLETRPYMRAREALATALWYADEDDEAIEHLRAMLALDPEDHLGVRHQLLAYLLSLERYQEAEELLDQFAEEASALWTYTRAILRYSHEGPSRKANSNLQRALKYNPLVADYLLGRRQVADDLQDIMEEEYNEAPICFMQSVHLWLRAEGAIEWLRKRAPRRLH